MVFNSDDMAIQIKQPPMVTIFVTMCDFTIPYGILAIIINIGMYIALTKKWKTEITPKPDRGKAKIGLKSTDIYKETLCYL